MSNDDVFIKVHTKCKYEERTTDVSVTIIHEETQTYYLNPYWVLKMVRDGDATKISTIMGTTLEVIETPEKIKELIRIEKNEVHYS